MLNLDKYYITEDFYSILTKIKDSLPPNTSHLLSKIKRTGNSILIPCPYHKNGLERHLSCSIITSDIKDLKAGTVHCFTCKKTINFEEFVSNCFGYDDKGIFGKEWLINNYITLNNSRDLRLSFNRDAIIESDITEEELEKYRYFHPYMYERKLTNKIIYYFDIGFDSNYGGMQCITFPIRDIAGNTLFIARRAIDIKFFDYPKGCSIPLYGLYELNQHGNIKEDLYICESMFDCLTCWVYGKQALALNGLGNANQLLELKYLPHRSIILALDNDKAGIRAKGDIYDKLKGVKDIKFMNFPQGKKDVNDLSEDEFNNCVLTKELITDII